MGASLAGQGAQGRAGDGDEADGEDDVVVAGGKKRKSRPKRGAGKKRRGAKARRGKDRMEQYHERCEREAEEGEGGAGERETQGRGGIVCESQTDRTTPGNERKLNK